jgi:hypothetical protein
MIDLDAIKQRIPKYGSADMRALVAEVERLREFRNNAMHAGNDEVAEAVAEERAAVVAWLREEAEPSPQSFTVRGKEWAKRIDDIADFIERGEHRREDEP